MRSRISENGTENRIRLTTGQLIRFLWHAVPEMMQFQILTKGLLALSLFLLKRLANILMKGGGYPVITGSDILKIIRTWQGILLIILIALVLFLYTAFEILSQIINSDNIMKGRKTAVWQTYIRGIASLKAFVSAGGIPLIIFITFAVPLTGIGYTISLTRDFRLPNFITSVIFSTPWMVVLYVIGIASAIWFSVRNTYTFPAVILEGMTVKCAKRRSVRIISEHKTDIVTRFLPLFALHFGAGILVELLFGRMPLFIAERTGDTGRSMRLGILFAGVAGDLIQLLMNMLFTGALLLTVTVLYRFYTSERIELHEEQQELIRLNPRIQIASVLALCVAGAVATDIFLSDAALPVQTAIIGHRGGGNLGAENTLQGLLAAKDNGAYGSEIDIQRTSDGYYIVNHDTSFKRLCGISEKPSEMALSEVKQLTVSDSQSGTLYLGKIAELTEVMDAVGDSFVLFIELKGDTADEKMADDVAQMIRERGMLGNCVVISLKRDLISYVETKYPELLTGVLYYIGYGAIEDINADLLVMEENLATNDSIDRAHRCGKSVIVWTVNTKESMLKIFNTDADAVITDQILLSQEIREGLNERSEAEKLQDKMQDKLKQYFG